MFVNVSNLNFYRGSPFLNKLASKSSFLGTFMVSPPLFLLSTVIVLRGKTSLSSLPCLPESVSCQGVPYSLNNSFAYNMLAWTFPFFIGLHFTYSDKLKMGGFNIQPSRMRRFGADKWALFFGICIFTIWIIGGLCWFYIKAAVLWYYLGFMLAIALSFTLPAVVLRRSHELHIHHYNIGMIFVLLIGYQSPWLTPLSGLFNGFMVEGVATYAFDPVFKLKHRLATESTV
jgi:hypothetical protein